jgi:hypothetical protein
MVYDSFTSIAMVFNSFSLKPIFQNARTWLLYQEIVWGELVLMDREKFGSRDSKTRSENTFHEKGIVIPNTSHILSNLLREVEFSSRWIRIPWH